LLVKIICPNGCKLQTHGRAAPLALKHIRMSEAPTASAHPPTSPDPGDRKLTGGLPVEETGGILTINLAAIEANWRALANRVFPAECGAVIKADAYGCGIEPVARRLASAGCKTFFVATLLEARRVRGVTEKPAIYVLNGLLPHTAPAYAEIHAQPVIGSLIELAEWDAYCTVNHWHGGAALHVDTGMNRLGISVDEAAALASRLRTQMHSITLLMSHFSCSEIPEHPLNKRQIELFREMRRLYRGIPSSLANSSGIFLGAAAHGDMVRPGVALYGVNPAPGHDNVMQPAISLQARIVQVRTVPKGEAVGYDATWTARRTTRLAVVAIGYADGYPRAASASNAAPGGSAIVAGKRCPIAGRISMDLLAVDITSLPEHSARRGDLVTLINGELTVDAVARAAGTISYEVLTSLGRRYHRVYQG
jgi:alanine racemase